MAALWCKDRAAPMSNPRYPGPIVCPGFSLKNPQNTLYKTILEQHPIIPSYPLLTYREWPYFNKYKLKKVPLKLAGTEKAKRSIISTENEADLPMDGIYHTTDFVCTAKKKTFFS